MNGLLVGMVNLNRSQEQFNEIVEKYSTIYCILLNIS